MVTQYGLVCNIKYKATFTHSCCCKYLLQRACLPDHLRHHHISQDVQRSSQC